MTEPVLFVLTGKMRAGKDTVAEIFISKYGFKRVALADALKEYVAQRNGITVEELEKNKSKYRQELIQVGQQKRKENINYWIEQLDIDFLNKNNCIITDARFLNELEFFRKMRKTHVVKFLNVCADDNIRQERGAQIEFSKDASEVELDGLHPSFYDLIIFNNKSKLHLVSTIESYINGYEEVY